MITKVKYRLIKIKEHYSKKEWSNMEGLVDIVISNDCCKFLPEVFDNIGEADEFRKCKDFPDDYLIVNCF